MKTSYLSNNSDETRALARELLRNLKGVKVILLRGELGAGKTTFAQSVLDIMGAEGPFTSPTFVIMKKYDLKNSKFEIRNSKFTQAYHFDCYRVGAQDILDLGWQEIIANPKNLVLVEWPERIAEIWPPHFLKIAFYIQDEERRRIKFEYF